MDKKFSFVIPIYKTEKFIERCIDSLLTQDYKNIEIICVLDGKNEEVLSILNKYKDNDNVVVKEIEHGGACRARNEGYKLTSGDYVSFFNSDYVAVPGMISTWKEAFDDDISIGFVYSGYGYIPESSNPKDINPKFDCQYDSEEFDAYKLECFNFIDCGSPIKHEVFQPWDVNCKSLQDWDFFLRLVKSGVRGKWVQGILYGAEYPRLQGLSDDSSHNWIDRVQYVKKNHNIPIRDMAVSSLGAPRHAVNIAKMLDFDFRAGAVMNKPHLYKVQYLIGFYKDYKGHANIFRTTSPDCIKILHWVGADIYWLRDLKFAEVKYLISSLNKTVDFHLVENEQMQEEMASYGVQAKIVPIPPPGEYSLLPLPEEFTVAIMKTNKSDFDKYCGNLMDEVMAAMPHVKFLVFGDGKCNRKLPNVTNLGYIKMPDLLVKSSCILRIVRHDGPMMACNEFVMSGRDAITNLKQPYMEFIDTSIEPNNWDKFGAGFNPYNYPDTKAKIIDKIIKVKEHQAGNKDRNMARKYYVDLLDKKVYKSKIYDLIREVKHG